MRIYINLLFKISKFAFGYLFFPFLKKIFCKFDNNQPKGHGTWNFENGNVVEGDYTQIKRADVDEEDAIKLSWKTTSDITAPI